jgi:hypothetical protein
MNITINMKMNMKKMNVNMNMNMNMKKWTRTQNNMYSTKQVNIQKYVGELRTIAVKKLTMNA